jgi:hypothetical protein
VRPKINVAALAKPAAREHFLRFIFGGVVSVFTGVVAHRYGPEIGGLFLAFPAILPASLTLVQQHDGRRQAIADARGGRLGALALVVFALVTRACAVRQYGPVVTLGIATCLVRERDRAVGFLPRFLGHVVASW